MNIRDAIILARLKNGWLMKRDRTDDWAFYVAAGSVFMGENGIEITLDARDCIGDDWYVVDDDGNEISQFCE